MKAGTLNCPTCGASLASDETRCRYCGTRLAIIACSTCFGMMFVGSRFCPHCGNRSEKPQPAGPALACPDCRVLMKQIRLKETPLQECGKCHGLWIDADSFERICADRERQADVLGTPSAQAPRAAATVRYRPCPQCQRLMNRVNFAHTSGVVVDMCKGHGIWFDREELRHIVEFIRAGGMELSRGKLAAKAHDKQREAEAQRRIDATARAYGLRKDDDAVGLIFSAGTLLGKLLR